MRPRPERARPADRGGFVPFLLVACVSVLVGLGPPSSASAQVPASRPASAGDPGEVTMQMLYEATIFRVDVLTLTVRIGGETAARLRELARATDATETGRAPDVLVDSIARLAAQATNVRATLGFERDVALGRFLDEIRASTRAALDAGFVNADTYDMVDRSLPEWYSFLEGRGVRDGDEMLYRIDGDTLNVRYRTADDALLLDQTDVGADRRRAVLGGYFAPDSEFREGLIDSLLSSEGTPRP